MGSSNFSKNDLSQPWPQYPKFDGDIPSSPMEVTHPQTNAYSLIQLQQEVTRLYSSAYPMLIKFPPNIPGGPLSSQGACYNGWNIFTTKVGLDGFIFLTFITPTEIRGWVPTSLTDPLTGNPIYVHIQIFINVLSRVICYQP